MNIAEAKAKLSELIARAEAGEEVIIARDGTPAVRLLPARSGRIVLGALAHLGPIRELDPKLWDPDPLDAEAAMRSELS